MCLTADSHADHADSRRQKTGWGNGSAKADAVDLADKDSYHTVEILFTLFVVCLRVSALSAGDNAVHVDATKSVRGACSFLICERPVLPQISQIHADERQVDQMDLLKQMPRSR